MKDAPFLNLVLAVVLVLALGWLLVVGRPILLPIVTAVIAVYVIVSASEALGRVPGFARLPTGFRRFLVLGAFTVALLSLAVVVAATVRDLAAVAPDYQANLSALFTRIAEWAGFEADELWAEIRADTLDRIDLQRIVLAVFGGFTSFGSVLFLVIVYAAFMIGERGGFSQKVVAAFGDEIAARNTLRIVGEINTRISEYLAVKTLINLILGTLSYVVLWAVGVDFALFWATTIGLLNYIPYVGSLLGVSFPVLLSLAQFGSLPTTLVLGTLLVGAQVYVGNVLEPRMIGRQLNLSPFVVLVALSVWSAIWGVPGAILAIPMTSILTIILASFEATRFLALLLAERIETEERRAAEG